MKNRILVKFLSLVLVLGMLFSVAPINANAENHTTNTAQTMQTQATVKLSGVVRDGGVNASRKHGYPLYAKLTLTAGEANLVTFSDPITGHYEVDLESGVEYALVVEPMLPGYQKHNGTVNITAATTENFDINIAGTCNAPGYSAEYPIFYTFEDSDEGFVAGGTNPSWNWGEITNGPGQAYNGTKGIATDVAGNYNNSEDSWFEKTIDLTSLGEKTPYIQFWHWIFVERAGVFWDYAFVEVSKDNGASWERAMPFSPRQDTEYSQYTIILDPTYNVANFKIRFRFKSDDGNNAPGFYIDDIGIFGIALQEPTHVLTYQFDDPAEPAWTPGVLNETMVQDWQQGTPVNGPTEAHSGEKVWATNLTGNYSIKTDEFITSPTIDLSSYQNVEIEVRWFDWLKTESATATYDNAAVWATKDGETYEQVSGNFARHDVQGNPYTPMSITIPHEYATANFKLRFHFHSDMSDTMEGWYVDDIAIYVKPYLGENISPCGPDNGGLVAGYVFDKNFPGENVKLIGAEVRTANASDTTEALPEDEAHTGLYTFFQKTTGSSQDIAFSVSKPKYGTETVTRTVNANQVNAHNFELDSGRLVVVPNTFEQTMNIGDADATQTMTIKNTGTAAANVSLSEINKGFVPLNGSVAPRALNIPAFSSPVEIDTAAKTIEPASQVKTNADTIELQMLPEAEKYGIHAAPAAVAVETNSSKLIRWEDITKPDENTILGDALSKQHSGDFVGSDFKTLYAISTTDKKFYSINLDTAEKTEIATLTLPTGTNSFTGLTGADGFLYGVATSCSRSFLFKLELDGTLTVINEIIGNKCAIDVAYVPTENAIFTVDIMTENLHRYDLETGNATQIGHLGISPNYAQGMDYDDANGILYWAAYDMQKVATLRVIDLETGASALVANYPSRFEVDSLAIETYHDADPVSWLSEDPMFAEIAPNAERNITLTFSVQGITQPGDYAAELRFKNDTPVVLNSVPVTLHIPRPTTWGSVAGVVSGLEKCDVNPSPVKGATIKFFQDGELVETVKTDVDGSYSLSFNAGSYDVQISLQGYVLYSIEDVVIEANTDLTLDANLRLDAGCLSVIPEALSSVQGPNHTVAHVLTFKNTGAGEAIFDTAEYSPNPTPQSGPVSLVIDDGTPEGALGIGGNSQFITVNRFTPADNLFPLTIKEVSVFVENEESAIGDDINVYLFENKTSAHNPGPGSTFRGKQAAKVTKLNDWNVITLEEPVTFEGPGDILVGIGWLKTPGTTFFPAVIDKSSSQKRSWLGHWGGVIPEEPTLPATAWSFIDDVNPSFAGNWMIRATGESLAPDLQDLPWFSLDNTAGIVPADSEFKAIATFDSTDLSLGEYFGQLMVQNLPGPKLWVPLKLKVTDEPTMTIHFPLIFSAEN